MIMRVLIVHASADGSTAEIARRIAQRLRERGHEASDQPVGATGSPDGVDAVVLGSAAHNRQWLGQATSFVNANRQASSPSPAGSSCTLPEDTTATSGIGPPSTDGPWI
jgi:menaquinone-dependent protoporphyrinogen oxidase